jgi:DNA-binding IclR family transcriptional regulator
LEACREWLLDTLRQHGEMKPGHIAELAKEAGFSKSMLYQARNSLGDRILANRSKHDPDTTWTLP